MKQLFLCLAVAALLAASCNKPVICSEEFRMISVTVTGGKLTDYYTLRESTNTVIRHNDLYDSKANWYPVLTDNYQPNMVNKQEVFRFIGIIDSVKVVDEEYVIRADKCHIDLVSGKETVRIK